MTDFRDWVPKWLAFFLILFAALSIQSVSGMFGVAFHNVTLSNGLSASDTSLMLRVMLTGVSCFFAFALRLKSLFSPKQAISLSLAAVLVCMFIFPRLTSMSMRFLVCTISGFFQMYATFEAIGMMREPIMKKANFGIFLSFVILFTLGSIDIFGCIISWLSVSYGETMTLQITAAFPVTAFVLVQVLMKGRKPLLPAIPKREWTAYVIELLFLILLTIALLFLFYYVDENGWVHMTFNEAFIPLLIIAVLSCAGIFVIQRLSGVSLIGRQSYFFKEAIQIALIFLILDFLMVTQNILQTGFISDHSSLVVSVTNMRLYDLAGIIIGFVISAALYRKGTDKTKVLTLLSSVSMLLYAVMMFLATRIDADAPVKLAYSSSIFLGISHLILFCIFNVYLMGRIGLASFFPAVCLLGILRNCVGMSLCGSIVYSSLASIQSMEELLPTMNHIYGTAVLLTTIPILATAVSFMKANKYR